MCADRASVHALHFFVTYVGSKGFITQLLLILAIGINEVSLVDESCFISPKL